MKKIALLTGLGLMVIVGLVFCSAVMWTLSVYNSNVALEQKILAIDQQNKNNLSSLTLRVKEMGNIPGMAVDGLATVTRAAMSGRYGPEGSKAVVQFIHEQNPTLDQSLYSRIMSTIENGRMDFERNQKQKIDICREYTTIISKAPRSIVSGILGFPKIDINPNSTSESAPCRILVSGDVREKFKSGIDDVIEVK